MLANGIPIEIEGPDKVGKDTLHSYIALYFNYEYVINSRGLLTQLVYNDKFDRKDCYLCYYKPLTILLDVDDLDHKIRCRMNHEPTINLEKDRLVYDAYAKELEKNGCVVLRYNTSELTPMEIVEDIKKQLSSIDFNCFICMEPFNIENKNYYTKEDLKNEEVYYGDVHKEDQ